MALSRPDPSVPVPELRMTSRQHDLSPLAQTRTPRDAAVALRGPVEAELVYALDQRQTPYFYMYEPPAGKPRSFGDYGSKRVRLEDGRDASRPFELDVEGFAFGRHSTALADAYDDAAVRSVYYPEMERLVLEATGAERVLVFDHNVRNGSAANAGARGVSEPVRRVHNDYTAESALRRLRQLLPAEADVLGQRRYAFINVWRPLFSPVLDTPLAVCDARSIDPSDLVKIELIYPDRVGENYNFAYQDRHRWFYFSQMRADEVLLLKCMDTPADGRARFTAHTAFDDRRAPAAARPRESIEIRTIAFYR
jgi:hypothetical protein